MKSTTSFLIFILLFIQNSLTLHASDQAVQLEGEEISIIAVGDITIGSNFTSLIERQGAGIFFKGTASIIQSADVATVSLNSSISDRGERILIVNHVSVLPPVLHVHSQMPVLMPFP